MEKGSSRCSLQLTMSGPVWHFTDLAASASSPNNWMDAGDQAGDLERSQIRLRMKLPKRGQSGPVKVRPKVRSLYPRNGSRGAQGTMHPGCSSSNNVTSSPPSTCPSPGPTSMQIQPTTITIKAAGEGASCGADTGRLKTTTKANSHWQRQRRGELL